MTRSGRERADGHSIPRQELCELAAIEIQTKSHHIEDAVYDVIDLLCEDILMIDANKDLQIRYSSVGLGPDNEDSDGRRSIRSVLANVAR